MSNVKKLVFNYFTEISNSFKKISAKIGKNKGGSQFSLDLLLWHIYCSCIIKNVEISIRVVHGRYGKDSRGVILALESLKRSSV